MRFELGGTRRVRRPSACKIWSIAVNQGFTHGPTWEMGEDAVSRRAWWPWVLAGSLLLSLVVCLRALRAAESALGEERRRVRVLSAELEPLRAELEPLRAQLERTTRRFEAASERQNVVRAECAPAPCAADGKTVPQRPEPPTMPRDESMAELGSQSGRVEVAPGGPMAPIAY